MDIKNLLSKFRHKPCPHTNLMGFGQNDMRACMACHRILVINQDGSISSPGKIATGNIGNLPNPLKRN